MWQPRDWRRWCVGFIFSLGLAALFLWLAFRPRSPRYFVVDLQVPRFANRTGQPRKTTVRFDIEVENKNKQLGISYEPFAVILGSRNKSGSVTVPGFYQGHGKTADKYETAEAPWLPWSEASGEVAKKGTATFHVSLDTAFRYRTLMWKGRRRWLRLGTDVEVGADGKMGNKGIRLMSSAAPPPAGARWGTVVAAPAVVMAVAVAVALLAQPLVSF